MDERHKNFSLSRDLWGQLSEFAADDEGRKLAGDFILAVAEYAQRGDCNTDITVNRSHPLHVTYMRERLFMDELDEKYEKKCAENARIAYEREQKKRSES